MIPMISSQLVPFLADLVAVGGATELPAAGDGAEEGKPNPLPDAGGGDGGNPNPPLDAGDVGGGEGGSPNPPPDDGWGKDEDPPAAGACDG